jgi:hypothetical protein
MGKFSTTVSSVRVVAVLVLFGAFAACTETPSYLPPCVEPGVPCPQIEAGADASSAAEAATDAPEDAQPKDVVTAP